MKNWEVPATFGSVPVDALAVQCQKFVKFEKKVDGVDNVIACKDLDQIQGIWEGLEKLHLKVVEIETK